MARDDHMIAALKRERAGYVARGDDDRVRQVDEQLERYGCTPAEDAGPQGRTEPPAQTTDAGTPQQTADAGSAATPPAKKTAAAKKTTAPQPKAE